MFAKFVIILRNGKILEVDAADVRFYATNVPPLFIVKEEKRRGDRNVD
ncbi:MAG: hypothetical protein ACXQS5_03895 [Candidatus Methanospirareceae archaeon]